jgi:hypothetical protein
MGSPLVPTVMPTAASAGPEAVVEQALQALEIQDEVGLRRLMDPALGNLGALLPGNAMANWRSYRTVLKPNPMGPSAFGPVQGWELEAPEQRGQTTVIVAHVRHDTGKVDWTFSLAQTADGWRLSDIRSAPVRPTTIEPTK